MSRFKVLLLQMGYGITPLKVWSKYKAFKKYTTGNCPGLESLRFGL